MSIEVLYIGGAGRSGSTIIEMIIGSMPGYLSVGEIQDFWHQAITEGVLCGCGKKLTTCETWSGIIHMLEQDKQLDFVAINQLNNKLNRTLKTGLLAIKKQTNAISISVLLSSIESLYRALIDQEGNLIIVDSSKTPSHLYLLSLLPVINLHVLHLVRDPRAVAYSWKCRAKKEISMPGTVYMEKRQKYNSILRWMVENFLVGFIGKKQKAYTALRYEDFVDNPRTTLHNALLALGFSPPDLSFLSAKEIDLSLTHSVRGNPVRFNGSGVMIKESQEWLENTTGLGFITMGLATLPLLLKFHYPLMKKSKSQIPEN